MIEHLEKDIERLEAKKQELLAGLAEMDASINKLLEEVIKISIKFPDQKEFISFVIFLNDTTVRSVKDIKSHMLEVIDILIRCKRIILQHAKEEQQAAPSRRVVWPTFEFLKRLLINRVFAVYFFGFICMVLYLIYPAEVEHFIGTLLPKIFGIGKG